MQITHADFGYIGREANTYQAVKYTIIVNEAGTACTQPDHMTAAVIFTEMRYLLAKEGLNSAWKRLTLSLKGAKRKKN